jgi:hypothetical protein
MPPNAGGMAFFARIVRYASRILTQSISVGLLAQKRRNIEHLDA